jgi:tetratricopeptide (TPR) repeat protein
VRFLLAESYRKSAIEIAAVLERTPVMSQRAEMQKARQDRLLLASQEFARVIGALDAEALEAYAVKRKLTSLEQDYLRIAYMDRAQCHLERGEYEEAISLYDRAAARFSEELIAVQAYVQIVNAYLREGKLSQASAAAERGRWMLKRIPDTAFEKSTAGVNRAYFEKLLSLGSV